MDQPIAEAPPTSTAATRETEPEVVAGISSGVFGGIGHLLSFPSQHAREGRSPGLQQLLNGDRQRSDAPAGGVVDGVGDGS